MEEIKVKNQEKKEIIKIEIKDITQKNIVTSLYPAYVSEYPIEQLIHYLHR